VVVILKEGSTEEQQRLLWDELSKQRGNQGMDAWRFCRIFEVQEDALDYQRRIRDEWE
jgi:hypothetical protein